MVEKSLKIHIFRHGRTEYLHKAPYSQSFEEADDLTKEGVKDIRDSAKLLLREIKKDAIENEKVVIWSSPVPRAMYSAKIIYNVLLNNGVEVENPRNNLFFQFEEVRKLGNYEVTLNILINGGVLKEGGRDVIVDKSVSNPRDLKYPDYFVWGEMFNIDITKLPKSLQNWINEVESCHDVTKRVSGALKKAIKASDKNYRIIIVSHDSSGFMFVNLGSHEKELEQPRGSYITLEREGNELKVRGSSFNNSFSNDEGFFAFVKRKMNID